MNYQKIYDSIIQRAQSRTLDPSIYVEKHHIIPECMGGTEKVPLTAKEHFICHLILHKKLYPNNDKLRVAYILMSGRNKKFFSEYKNSRLYETSKLQHAQYISRIQIGTFWSKKHLYNFTRSRIGMKYNETGKKRKPKSKIHALNVKNSRKQNLLFKYLKTKQNINNILHLNNLNIFDRHIVNKIYPLYNAYPICSYQQIGRIIYKMRKGNI